MNASAPQAYTIRGVDSMPADIASPLHLGPLKDKAILVDFEGGLLSSEGGLILLNDPDEQGASSAWDPVVGWLIWTPIATSSVDFSG